MFFFFEKTIVTMVLHRVVLLVPFIRHYAGSVFELYESTEPDAWDPDGWVQEKISYNRYAYQLPDNGKGLPTRLLKSDTIPCPPALFEGQDLRSGPCRVTLVQSLPDGSGSDPDAQLSDIGGISGQAVLLRLDAAAKPPFRITLRDSRDDRELGAFESAENPVRLDFSTFQPGFYSARIESRNGVGAVMQMIKCFPLVAQIREGGRDITSTMKTVW